MTCHVLTHNHNLLLDSSLIGGNRGSATVGLLLQGSVRDIGELFHDACNNCHLIYLFTIGNIVPSSPKVKAGVC